MSKNFFSLEIQIEHLKANKAVILDDVQLAQEILLKVNYYNFLLAEKLNLQKQEKQAESTFTKKHRLMTGCHILVLIVC